MAMNASVAATTLPPLLAVLKGEKPSVPPIWLMRQAGRYLPEYRALREKKGGFLELCYDPVAAAEITLQPIRRFGFDGAILFSDILIVPHAMGQTLWFEAGEGPRLAPPLAEADLSAFTPDPSRLAAIWDTVSRVRSELPPGVAFLGFAGSPWTVATYMVAGAGSKDHGAARRLAYADPGRFGAIINAIVETTVTYLDGQIRAGVDAVQLFESWAGSLSPQQFARWVIAPNAEIVRRIKALHPDIPVIGFPKGAGAKLIDYVTGIGLDAVGLDETIDPVWAARSLPANLPVQGNLDPLALIAGGDALDQAVDAILAAFADRPHIFNLGHGILPDTPIDHVQRLIDRVRGA
jgi:uroporphyrinogen decarboxylase